METKQIKSAKDLRIYKTAYALAMEIFNISKQWPSEEKFSLIDQIRRSSRSVCANLREAWAKRRYKSAFYQQANGCGWGKQRNGYLVGFCKGLWILVRGKSSTSDYGLS